MTRSPDPGWIDAQRRNAAGMMRAATSATHLCHDRPGFGWQVRPAPGSILASARDAHWDPEPDYFHHWIRDAAIILGAVPLAIRADPGSEPFWRQAVTDHLAFCARVSDPDACPISENPLKPGTDAEHRAFLRPDAELATLRDARRLEEPRVAADGTPDLERWSRPQDDGPALRAVALMQLQAQMPEARGPVAETLIDRDLAHVLRVAGRPCIGPWEEEPARRTTFTLIAQWDALDRAATRAARSGTPAAPWRAAADRLAALMDKATDSVSGGWRESTEAPPGQLDSATALAILHAGRETGPFALTAPRTLALMAGLDRIFADLYPINRGQEAIAIGRWADDVYFGGNPWVPNTLGLAELRYRIARLTGDAAAFAKAERGLRAIERLAPDPSQPLPEQFHRETGTPTSCLALTWSAAAFLGAAAAREAAVQTLDR